MFHVKHAADPRHGAGFPAAGEPSSERRTVRYTGHVQGVGFRCTVRSLLEHQPITGYIRNLGDGTVELVAEGTEAALDAAEERIEDRLGACIRDSRRSRSAASGEFSGFTILR